MPANSLIAGMARSTYFQLRFSGLFTFTAPCLRGMARKWDFTISLIYLILTVPWFRFPLTQWGGYGANELFWLKTGSMKHSHWKAKTEGDPMGLSVHCILGVGGARESWRLRRGIGIFGGDK